MIFLNVTIFIMSVMCSTIMHYYVKHLGILLIELAKRGRLSDFLSIFFRLSPLVGGESGMVVSEGRCKVELFHKCVLLP